MTLDGFVPPARAFVEQNGVATLLPAPDDTVTFATAMNDGGTVVGAYTPFGSNDVFPLRWAGGSMTLLPDLPGVGTTPMDINGHGLIVGVGNGRLDGRSHAVLWDQDLNVIDLQTAIPADSAWQLMTAMGINSSGQIVGWGSYNGAERAFVLTLIDPNTTGVPEPTCGGTVAVAMLYGLTRRRRWSGV